MSRNKEINGQVEGASDMRKVHFTGPIGSGATSSGVVPNDTPVGVRTGCKHQAGYVVFWMKATDINFEDEVARLAFENRRYFEGVGAFIDCEACDWEEREHNRALQAQSGGLWGIRLNELQVEEYVACPWAEAGHEMSCGRVYGPCDNGEFPCCYCHGPVAE